MKNSIAFILLFLINAFSMSTLKAQQPEQMRNEIVADLKSNVLPFWEKYSVDPSGGFYGTLLRDGTPVADSPKGGVLNARIVWTFSKAYSMYGDSKYLELANRAQRYFIDHFIDPQYGGVYWLIKADGTPLDTEKQTYGCSYAIYGLSEHYKATGNKESLEKAIEIYRTMESKIKDPVNDGYIESFTREWKKPEKYGYDGTGVATKTMNTHIHVLEAYTALYNVWKDKELKARLAKVIDLLTTKLYNPTTHHLILYCDSQWNNLDDIDSYGHDIETAWLLTEAADAIGDKVISQKCKKISLDLVNSSLNEGINNMGAMMYERHKDTIRDDISWWCQAETVIGCVNAWQLTGEKKYLDYALTTWNFIKTYIVDKKEGEWFRSLSNKGVPDLKQPKASMWNCPYHNSRMGFEIDSRLSL